MLGSPLRFPKLQPHSTKQFLSPLTPEDHASFLVPVCLTPLQSVTFQCDLLASPKRKRMYQSPLRTGHFVPKPKSLSPSHVSSHNQLNHDGITRTQLRRRLGAVVSQQDTKPEKRYSPLSSFPLQKKLRRKQCRPYDWEWISPRRSQLSNAQVATITFGCQPPILSPYCSPCKVALPLSKPHLPPRLPLSRPAIIRPPPRSRESSEEDVESVSSWVVQSPKYL